jgi:SAM-dependent methyltransferase
MNNLTDKNFWAEGWAGFKPSKVPSKTFFTKYIPKEVKNKNNFIEIGGFPGTYSVYFHQQFGLDATLLDFFIDRHIIDQVEAVNLLPKDTIHCIDTDFFTFNPNQKYDVVFSSGFIEHFQDTKDVIDRHIEWLADNGVLLILLPNFRGFNGWLNKIFCRKSYNAHNINSMRIDFLRKILCETALQNFVVQYTSKPMLWLSTKSKLVKLIVKCGSHFLKLFPIPSRLLSPYIIISGVKK